MKALSFFLILLFSLFLQLGISFSLLPPLLFLGAPFFSAGAALFFAISMGVLADALSTFPFGIYAVSFFSGACVEILLKKHLMWQNAGVFLLMVLLGTAFFFVSLSAFMVFIKGWEAVSAPLLRDGGITLLITVLGVLIIHGVRRHALS